MISKIIKNFLNKLFISNFRELLFQPIKLIDLAAAEQAAKLSAEKAEQDKKSLFTFNLQR